MPTPQTLDPILTLQLSIAWAGESGEQPRLGWWQTDLCSEFGGEDLLRQLAPSTWSWAVFEATREAARRTDAAQRGRAHDPDTIVSLYRLGFAVDEALDQRLYDLKTSGRSPQEALPGLGELTARWDRDGFGSWLTSMGSVKTTTTPSGRQLAGEVPENLEQAARSLAAALLPLGEQYPLPHFRRRA